MHMQVMYAIIATLCYVEEPDLCFRAQIGTAPTSSVCIAMKATLRPRSIPGFIIRMDRPYAPACIGYNGKQEIEL